LNVVDFLAIFPWYLEHIAPGAFDGQVLRVVRLLRVVRIFKLGKSNSTFTILGTTIKVRKSSRPHRYCAHPLAVACFHHTLGTTIKNSLPALELLLFFNVSIWLRVQ
jgi:hypothetical protein